MLFIGLANLLFIDENLGGFLHTVERDGAAHCDLCTTPLRDRRYFTAPTPTLGVKHMPPVTRTQGITDNDNGLANVRQEYPFPMAFLLGR